MEVVSRGGEGREFAGKLAPFIGPRSKTNCITVIRGRGAASDS